MSGRNLRYSLSLDREEFENAEALVKSVLLTSKRKQGPFDTLVHATEDYTSLSQSDQDYIRDWDPGKYGELEGLCTWMDDEPGFNIWLSPKLDPLTDLYRTSLLHELVHGLMSYSKHDGRFRIVLGRAIYHYCDIVTPLDSPGFQVLALNYRYTQQRKNESENDYMRRIIRDRDRIEAKAEAEYSGVLEMYERIR